MLSKNNIKLIILVVIIFLSGYLSFISEREKDKNITFGQFMIGKKEDLTLKMVLGGIIFGVIFGFMDNYFLITGLDLFDKYLPNDPKLKAGWGNTFSDFIGSTLGTFISVICINMLNINQSKIPIWANSLGMIIGCVVGMYLPYYVKKYNRK